MVFDHTSLDAPGQVWFPKFEFFKTGLNVFYCVGPIQNRFYCLVITILTTRGGAAAIQT